MHGLQSRSNALVIDHIYYSEEVKPFQFLIVIGDADEESVQFGDGTVLVVTANEKQNSNEIYSNSIENQWQGTTNTQSRTHAVLRILENDAKISDYMLQNKLIVWL